MDTTQWNKLLDAQVNSDDQQNSYLKHSSTLAALKMQTETS
jgi:hypothetical protein